MRKVNLRINELENYNIIKNLVDNNGNKNTAATKLHLSGRQIDLLIIKYKDNGKSSFGHVNRGQVAIKALDKSIYEPIILFYQNKYYDCNFNHFKDLLTDRENIIVIIILFIKNLHLTGYIHPKLEKQLERK